MQARLAMAEAAFAQGRIDDGVALLEQATREAGAAAPVETYRKAAGALLLAGRFPLARQWAEAGLKQHGEDLDLLNLLGMTLRRLGAYAEALAALDRALAVKPGVAALLMNKVAVYNEMRAGQPALDIALPLLAAAPNDPERRRLAGQAYRNLGQWEKAAALFDAAIASRPDAMAAWVDRISLAMELQQHAEALELLDRATARFPQARKLLEGRAMLLRRAGRTAEAEAFLRGVLAQDSSAAWAHHQLGQLLADGDAIAAAEQFRLAAALEPREPDHRMGLIANLTSPQMADIGLSLQEAYETLGAMRQVAPLAPSQTLLAARVYHSVGDYEALDALGSFRELGRQWVQAGEATVLLRHMGAVKTPQDRRELVEQHRLWGRMVAARAQAAPLPPRPIRRARGKIRMGIMSSDLRAHVAGLFAMPLFDFVDRDRFDLYGYSFNPAGEDEVQRYFASKTEAFRWWPDIADRDAAERIAADDLDILIEMGGLTALNRPEVLAYRPAPLQASWLGYPHSVGLEAIDHIVVDPYLKPEDPGLLVERPMVMPHSWLTMGPAHFRQDQPLDGTTPEERTGFVTFGTTNNPVKYGPQMLRAWARVVAATPRSRFVFIRPEASAPSFREHMLAAFAAEGVSADRVEFRPMRGGAAALYRGVDISLDTFPLTGGTSTCDSLWMGVPVVSLVGEALFERLSYSILSNAGLGDLVARSVDEYVDKAVALAGDLPRRMALRAGLRDMIRAGPLGRSQAFASDFYDLVARTVGAPVPDRVPPTESPDAIRNQARIYAAAGDWPSLAQAAARLAEQDPAAGDAPRLAAWAALQLGLARLEAGPRLGWPQGDSEGQALQAVHDAVVACLEAGIPGQAMPWVVPHVLMRLMAHRTLDRVGSFEALGRRFAAAGEHRVLLAQQARARPIAQDRLELVEQHRLWGRWAEALAAQAPALPDRPPRGARIRLGFLSSDLRVHAVGAFAWPLFEHLDPRFELYVYSFFPGPADALQDEIAGRVQAYRHMPEAGDDEAAAAIAADGLDVLIDLGGPTGWNRPRLMARRLAPVQASWLGYAHSSGLSTIDHILLDPHLVPPDPGLLIEAPLTLPASWIVMSGAHFREEPAPAPEPASLRNGFVTYGTANASYKYSPTGLDLWARVLAAAPGSRFLVVRPEAEAPSFRENLLAAFAARGVGPERVRFEAVRGAHLPFYGQMDVSLDTSPLTGGTTTCESLWMGVPVVSLVGDALYERLSASILTNAGLADLVAQTPEDYVATAVALGRDVDRLTALRRGLREQLRASPLGRTERFAKDFYDLVASLAR